MPHDEKFDVVVLGAGPASVLAQQLGRQKYAVLSVPSQKVTSDSVNRN